jgi:3-dehydroquinate dehydratase-2
MIQTVHIINGPNLNFLGKRETDIYGNQTMESILEELKKHFFSLNIVYYQSNHEGEIIDYIQKNFDIFEGIVINPGAFSHYSIAILDALKPLKCPVIEVHLSNIHQRETFRNHSITAQASKGVITGLGKYSYFLAIQYLIYQNG